MGALCVSLQSTLWSEKDTAEVKHPNLMMQEGSFLQTIRAKSLTARGQAPSFGYHLKVLQKCGCNQSKQGGLHGGGVA